MIDYSVYQRFMQRWTPEERRRLAELDDERRHYPKRCDFVDHVKNWVGDRPLISAAREMRDYGSWNECSVSVEGLERGRAYLRDGSAVLSLHEVSGEFDAR